MFVILLCGTLLCTAQAYHNRVSLSTTTTNICLVRSLLDSISGVLDSTYPLPNFFGPIIVTKASSYNADFGGVIVKLVLCLQVHHVVDQNSE
ncbi:hypothetical protein JHK85_040269 [Glycine max]|nr:hypothetical protein JHK86_039691 [Glycine max]KAG4965294.1 hypothetical protein JHK85_040269 [Glycine max]